MKESVLQNNALNEVNEVRMDTSRVLHVVEGVFKGGGVVAGNKDIHFDWNDDPDIRGCSSLSAMVFFVMPPRSFNKWIKQDNMLSRDEEVVFNVEMGVGKFERWIVSLRRDEVEPNELAEYSVSVMGQTAIGGELGESSRMIKSVGLIKKGQMWGARAASQTVSIGGGDVKKERLCLAFIGCHGRVRTERQALSIAGKLAWREAGFSAKGTTTLSTSKRLEELDKLDRWGGALVILD